MKVQRYAKSIFALVSVFTLFSSLADPASAVLVVDIESDDITPDGQQQIDVFVHTNLPNNQTEGVFFYNLAYSIISVSTTGASNMTFPNPMNEDFVEDSSYIFFDNSDKGSDPLKQVFEATANPANVLALDETLNRQNVLVGSTPLLLSRLTLQHNLNGETAGSVVGDIFEIVVNRDPRFDVAFENENGISVSYEYGRRGFITVVVPEPSTFAFTSLVALGLLPVRRRRR